MSRPVISVENLSKAYRIGLKEEVPDTLMSAMTGFLKAPLKRFQELRKLDTFRHSEESDDIYWALKDVSFEVKEGEVLGVIGRNGAGKSTLLKILSRITEPTKGRAVIRGRVSSLLEVGTGFHPELSGRENVYLNGTILGMTKQEIDRKFDEIVDFSGVEKFLDTPIKRYSSGMKVRLAFAVAAHLEPEILIIDEVLAVGDAEFQKKCMGKMQDVAKGGRTVLFVSHNLGALRLLCTSGVVLGRGRVVSDSNITDALATYAAAFAQNSSIPVAERSDRGGSGTARLVSVEVLGPEMAAVLTGAPMEFAFSLDSPARGIDCSFTVYDAIGNALLNFRSGPLTPDDHFEPIAINSIACRIEECPLVPGEYRLNVALTMDGNVVDHVEAAALFVVETGRMRNRLIPDSNRYATFVTPHKWVHSTL